ncbi:MAG: hypothetical protein MPK07_01925 [Alphaproteobacteria bacterium]|nr:hypothetical protein [Alphaproteobacteria bacterium]MDA8012672.1 hypothetical protein [Alphaproteobacteria bacterium]
MLSSTGFINGADFLSLRSAIFGISGREPWTGHSSRSSERCQLSPAGAARKKNNFVSLIKGQTTVTGAIDCPFFFFIFCRQRLRASVGAARLSQHLESLKFSLTNARGGSSGGTLNV